MDISTRRTEQRQQFSPPLSLNSTALDPICGNEAASMLPLKGEMRWCPAGFPLRTRRFRRFHRISPAFRSVAAMLTAGSAS